MRFAITGIEASAMVEPGETPPTLSLDPAEVKSVIVEGSAQYFPQSVEKSVDPIVVSGPGFIGAYATYHSADGKPSFMAFVGRTYACVTSATVRTTSSVLAITIGSDDCDGADHCAAVASLSALQVVGGSAAAAAPVAAAPVAAAPGAGAVSDADLNAIVAATLTHKDVAMYLHPEVKGRVPVRVAFSPPHDGRKVNINLYDKPVETVTDASKRASAVNLSLECQEAACKVSVSYRPEGIHGYVKLKSLDGKWEVEEASILE
jgi:hypothetical protein